MTRDIQRRERIGVVIDGVALEANPAENPLAWLATRKDKDGQPLISPEEYAAGRRLHAEFSRGAGPQRVTQSWDQSGVRGGRRPEALAPAEAAADARGRVASALDAVGPELSAVLFAVCCEEIGLEAVEKRQRWPARSGKVVLRLALQRLATHYGIGRAAVGAPARKVLAWAPRIIGRRSAPRPECWLRPAARPI